MRLRAAILTIGLMLALAGSAEAAWYSASWPYRTQLTINGGLVPAAQTSFPVLVAWTADAKLAAGAQADGDDILFTAADGTTKLDHEIESYTPATGALTAWVRVLSVASGTNTTIYMYYGNPAAASQQNAAAVWASNFKAVWHLMPVLTDSTSNANNLTNNGSTDVAGQMARGRAFDGTSNYLSAANNASLNIAINLTVEAWVYLANSSADEKVLGKTDVGATSGYILGVRNAHLYPEMWDSTGTRFSFDAGTVGSNQWVHLAVTWTTGGNLVGYVNGSQVASIPAGTNPLGTSTVNALYLGVSPYTGHTEYFVNGRMDEARVSDTARSASWIQTEYNNLTNQGVGAGKFILAATAETLARVYYSVGTSAAALYTGNASAANGTLTLASAAANNIGVGDEIRRAATGRYYITGRVSPTVFTIQNSGYNGGTPGDTNITFASTAITIYRAFNSLRGAVGTAGTYFGDANHLKTTDLVTGNYQVNLPCYNDGVMPVTQATLIAVTGHTTGPASYIRIYTPVSASEVGVSQRHTGVFGTGFQLQGTNSDTIQVSDAYVRVEGLTIQVAVNVTGWRGGIQTLPSGTSDIRISQNIVQGIVTAGNPAYGINVGAVANPAAVSRVWDNIVYGFPNTGTEKGLGIEIGDGVAYVFSNTVYDCEVGIISYSAVAGSQVRNNVSINDAFNATFTDYSFAAPLPTRSNNVSSDATSETVALRGKTDYTNYFRNTTPGSEDLHIRNTSLALWGSAGANLWNDPNVQVTDDIDGARRRLSPDIGADEFGLPEVGTGCTGGAEPSGANFVQHGDFDKGKSSTGGGDVGNLFTTSATYSDWQCPGDTQSTIAVPPYPIACEGAAPGNGVAITQFPGDPHYGVAAAANSLYTNGNNTFPVGGPAPYQPYLIWRQTVTGLQPNKTYTFFLYASNGNNGAVATPPILPTLRFCKGVTGGPPYGCTTQLNAVDFSIPNETAASGDVWTRYQVTFTTGAAETSAELGIIDAATDGNGDDLQITQIGLQACGVPTAVELMSLEARGVASGVELTWQTGSELDNLGFHVWRGLSEAGPWTRVTSELMPGLGSSPIGASYSYVDAGLVGGQRYYYRLEDIDTRSVSTFHGPVSAVAESVPVGSSPPDEGGGSEPGEGTGPVGGTDPGGQTGSSCPAWVLASYEPEDGVTPTCTKHGDPESVSLEVVSRDTSSATVELRTGGFWALHRSVAGAAGTGRRSSGVRVFVSGFDSPGEATALALPLRRALVEAVVGKEVSLVSAEARDVVSFGGMSPIAVGTASVAMGRDGTARPARRAVAAPVVTRGYLPAEVARLAGTVFQGERKSAVVEITPVRFAGQGLVLARTVRVRLSFAGVAEGETGSGSRGRARLHRGGRASEVLGRVHTRSRGLYGVSYESLFGGWSAGVSTSSLRLQRQGEAVAFHVEPLEGVFGPGSVLYFYAERTARSTDYTSEVAYELVRSRGVRMGVAAGQPVSGSVGATSSRGEASFEVNRIYQAGLLEAPDVWLWEALVSGTAAKTEEFALSGVDEASTEDSRLVVYLQGGSESGVAGEHHVRVSVRSGGDAAWTPVGEARFSGKGSYRLEGVVPAGALREGANEVSLENVGDAGVYSLVFLDRFEVSYPQHTTARGGVFEGVWGGGGTAEVGGLVGVPIVVDVTGAGTTDSSSPEPGGSPQEGFLTNDVASGTGVRWLSGLEGGRGSVRFQAEGAHRYVVVSGEGVLAPRIERVVASSLREGTNQADYLVIAPREFLSAATPLLERRMSQGLVSRGVSLEEISAEFGHAQPSGEAIREFVSYAYHSWRRPSPRYVLLLGDATYDPRQFLSTSWPSPLPALWEKTSYMWTASDAALGAVNGEDSVPDVAIGRLPATTREQAQALVWKVLSWEQTGQDLSGKAVLVADTPDAGGDFEWDVEDIRASFLSGRETTTLKVSELGSGARAAILGAFDEGASLVSYVGHGGTAVWSSANVLNTWDAPSLLEQSRQPVVLTMDCLNGYFVAPNFDALPEALLKAPGRGAVAAFSPSGLSLDGPAHEYHRAVTKELVSGGHERLGDAILAAQQDYAETGLMPELLTVYTLFGDPAMRIR